MHCWEAHLSESHRWQRCVPRQAFTLGAHRSDYEFSLIPSFEKQLSDNSGLFFVGGWDRITPGARQRETAGSADLSIYFRQGTYISVAHELQLPAPIGDAGRGRVYQQNSGAANSDVFSNLELEYSLEYLDNFVERLDVGRPWIDFVPYVQFNYAQSFIASRLTTSPDFRLTSRLAYLGDYCELSLGTQIALNNAASNGDHVAMRGLVEIFYDNIFPDLG
jgi:hypothetical protein